MCLYLWDYAVNQNGNGNEKEKVSSRWDINRPKSRHGHKHSK